MVKSKTRAEILWLRNISTYKLVCYGGCSVTGGCTLAIFERSTKAWSNLVRDAPALRNQIRTCIAEPAP